MPFFSIPIWTNLFYPSRPLNATSRKISFDPLVGSPVSLLWSPATPFLTSTVNNPEIWIFAIMPSPLSICASIPPLRTSSTTNRGGPSSPICTTWAHPPGYGWWANWTSASSWAKSIFFLSNQNWDLENQTSACWFLRRYLESKDIIKRVKRQPTEWKKIIANHISYKDLV